MQSRTRDKTYPKIVTPDPYPVFEVDLKVIPVTGGTRDRSYPKLIPYCNLLIVFPGSCRHLAASSAVFCVHNTARAAARDAIKCMTLVNPIKLDVFRCVPCYIPSNDPEYLLGVDR